MSYKTVADSSQLKFAEKLVILNDRAVGMLTRIYNMKKACADPKSQPQFLNDKTLESAISYIVKRFPAIDIKRNSTVYSSINDMKGNIIKKLSLYYYTFVDLLDLKDAILQLFTAMDANQCRLNIVIGVSLCHRLLSDPSLLQLFQKAMQHSLAVRLFRDETIFSFSMILTVLEPLKNQNKLLNELKEINILAIQTCGHLHAHRRHFLRMALKELYLLLVDEPGLLGPKILFVWMGLSMARDEIQWLLRHYDVWQQLLLQYSPANKKAIQKSGLQNIVVDNYYIEYIAGYDAPLLTELSQRFSGGSGLSEYEQLLIHSCIQSLANISDGIDSRGVHLDWFRFQALTSIGRSTFKLQVHANFAVAMNTALFHLKHIGNGLNDLLRETSDLSIYCFYPRIFDLHLRNCLDFPLQSRFSITFAHICAHFNSPLHELCPEENDTIIEKVCADGQQLVLSTEPRACANMFALEFQGKNEMKMPGFESIRQSGQPISSNDSNNLYLGELCQSLATTKELNISGHIFVPREFLFHQLEKYLNTSLLQCPRRPSEMLAFLSAQLNALQHLDIFYNFDLTRLFNDTLLQQSQRDDAQGNETLAEIYSKWYLEVLLRKASTCHLLYSEHMQSFVNNPSSDTPVNNNNLSTQLFRAERFTDPRELRSLSQIIGPFGIKFMEEKLVWHIASQITELFKIVREHNEQLLIARVNYDKPEKLKEVNVDLALANAIKQQANTNGLDDPNEHYKISCLLIVFIAISLPHLALNPQSCYKASLSVTKNNSHTIPLAVNTITGALFFLHQRGDTAERMHEFLALASSSLLQNVNGNININSISSDKIKGGQRQQFQSSVYLLLDQLARSSPWLNYGLMEKCFPFALIRSALLHCHKRENDGTKKMIGNQQENSACGQKRNFNEEQAYLNEQNDEIDVEGGREMPQNVLFETGKTNRGNLCLWHEGYCFTRNRGTNVINFRCEQRKCPASCKISMENWKESSKFIEGILGNSGHNHSPNYSKKLAKERRKEILQKIEQTPKKKASLLVADIKSNVSDDVSVEMGSDQALGHLIYRHRRRLFGNVDTANNLLDIEFPDFLINYKGQNILFYDSRFYRQGEEDVVLLFSHPSLFNLLETNNLWLINSKINEKVVVCIQCILPKREIKYFKESLNAIKNLIKQPKAFLKIISDFDFISFKAASQVFPYAQFYGSLFHFGQNLLRKWRLLGMQNLYSDQIIGKISIKIFRSLAKVYVILDYNINSLDIEKQLEIIQAPTNPPQKKKNKKKRLFIIQEEQILETLQQANYEEDGHLFDIITLLGLQIQGYISGLRDDEKGESDDDIEEEEEE
uniref:MULE transposase domain-containing protein n=1 Tax=Meloidogyne javanica TaxID=6303 RepID=A0A915M7G8_MELJA